MLRIRSTYLYLAVALGLFCYIFFIDTKNKSTKETTQSAGRLFEFNADEVTWLQITNANGTVVLEKQPDKRWKIVKPVQSLPEAGIVQQILGEVEFARSLRVIPYSALPGSKEETIKQWNLAPPVVSVEFKTAKEHFVLQLGRNVALTENIYARASSAPSAPVNIIRASIKTIVDRNLSDIRSRAVFDFDSAKVNKTATREFTSGSQLSHDVEITKDMDGKWSLQKPLVARADSKSLTAWLRQMQDLRIVEFVSDEGSNLSNYGLSSPVAQITVQTPDNNAEELSLIVGSSPADKPAEVYAKRLRSNSVFTLKRDAVLKIIAGLQDCRDKKLVTVVPADLNGVSIEQKGKTFSLTKKEGVWTFDGETNVTAELTKIQDFVNQLAGLQAVQFVKDTAADLRHYSLDKPVAKVTLRYTLGKSKDKDKDKEAPETGSVDLLFGKTENKLVYAKNSIEPFIYSVPAGVLDLLPKDAIVWRALQVVQLDKARIKEVAIVSKDGEVKYRREADGSFKTDVANHSVNAARADAQVSLLSSLRALAWLGKPLSPKELEKPTLKITVTSDAPAPVVLRVGAALPSGSYAAQVDGQPSAFELPLSDFNALDLNPISDKPQK